MSLFRLDASIRVEDSVSRQIADIVEAAWVKGHPDEHVVSRHIGTQPIPASAWAASVSTAGAAPESFSPEQQEAVALAATLVDELIEADALLFAVPLYNFGVSQHFKAYVDLIITDPRMGPWRPAAAGRQACRARRRAWRQLRRRHPARRLGPLHRVDPTHPGKTSGSSTSRSSRPSSPWPQ